jgi:DNA-binding transcriptional MocR family regulator
MDTQPTELQTAGGPAGALPFIYGHVDPTLFPTDRMRAAADEALRLHGPVALNYGAERGCGPLLAYLRAKIARDEGLELEKEDLMLTVGASGGLDNICRIYTQPGDTVLVEAPSYHEALDLIRDFPVRLAAVPLDEQGLIVEALAERLKILSAHETRPRLLYSIPTFQNPSGVTLSAERRGALLDLARRHDLLIVEDDVYRDLAFEAPPPPSLYALDRQDGGQTVIRLGSFSKILAPGLRVGWLMAAPEHVARLCDCGLYRSGGGANPFVAHVIAAFCQGGWLEPHIARLVEVYQSRRDLVLAALESAMPDAVRWTRPGGGFFVWMTLPEPLTARDVLEKAHQHSITFFTGEPFFAEGGGKRHIRLPFSFIPLKEMEEGVHTLGEIIQELL